MTEVNQPFMLIRKKLFTAEVSPDEYRINDTTGELEFSPDGGATWNDASDDDPRHGEQFRLPALTGNDDACDAAARMVALFQDNLLIFQNSINAAQFATDVMVVLLALSPVASIIAGIAIIAWNVLTEIGQSAIDEAFDSVVWDNIKCIIAAHIGSDGQMSLAQRDEIMSDIEDDHPGVVYDTLVNIVNLFGEVLLSNAGVERTETGDCDDCDDWCYTLDLAASAESFSAITGSYSGGNGFIQGGVNGAGCNGNDATYTYAQLERVTLPAGVYTEITFTWDAVAGLMCEANTDRIYNVAGGAPGGWIKTQPSVNTTGNDRTIAWTGTMTDPACIGVVVVCGLRTPFNTQSGSLKIKRVTFKGTGDNPFGADNCA